MTREEAIICLKGIKNYGRDTFNEQTDWQGCLDMAINALEQEPCEYAISREEVLWLVGDYDLSMGQVVKAIHALPSVTLQPKVGRWIVTDDDFVYCSECEDSYYPRPIDASWYYCPNCGAKMGVE